MDRRKGGKRRVRKGRQPTMWQTAVDAAVSQ
jgi:hypothetical protein